MSVRATVQVELQYVDPIGAIVGLKWKDCRVLTFAREIAFDALPPVGTTLFMTGSDNAIDVKVESVCWFDGEAPAWHIDTGRSVGSIAAEVLGDIEWMREQGFKWCEEDRVYRDPDSLEATP